MNEWASKAIKWTVIAVFSAIILSILGWGLEKITGLSAVWGGIFAVIAVAAVLIFAKAINPGKEFFLDLVPVILIVIAIIGTIAILWENSPLEFVVDFSFQGIALAVSAVIFANAVYNKLLKSI